MSEEPVRKKATRKAAKKTTRKTTRKVVAKTAVKKKTATQARKAPTPIATTKSAEKSQKIVFYSGAAVCALILIVPITIAFFSEGEIVLSEAAGDLREGASVEEQNAINSLNDQEQRSKTRDGGLVASGVPVETAELEPPTTASTTEDIATSTEAAASSTEAVVTEEDENDLQPEVIEENVEVTPEEPLAEEESVDIPE